MGDAIGEVAGPGSVVIVGTLIGPLPRKNKFLVVPCFLVYDLLRVAYETPRRPRRPALWSPGSPVP